MSTLIFYAKIELLPDHLKQQVLDYIDFLLSREAQKVPSIQKQEPGDKTEPKQPESRFAGRISQSTAQQFHQQLKEMRDEWH